MNLVRERAVLPLPCISESVLLAPPDLHRETVAIVFDLLDESAVAKGVEQAEAHPLREAGTVHDVPKPKRFAGTLKRAEDLRPMNERLHEIELVRGPRPWGNRFVAVHGSFIYQNFCQEPTAT